VKIIQEASATCNTCSRS